MSEEFQGGIAEGGSETGKGFRIHTMGSGVRRRYTLGILFTAVSSHPSRKSYLKRYSDNKKICVLTTNRFRCSFNEAAVFSEVHRY